MHALQEVAGTGFTTPLHDSSVDCPLPLCTACQLLEAACAPESNRAAQKSAAVAFATPLLWQAETACGFELYSQVRGFGNSLGMKQHSAQKSYRVHGSE